VSERSSAQQFFLGSEHRDFKASRQTEILRRTLPTRAEKARSRGHHACAIKWSLYPCTKRTSHGCMAPSMSEKEVSGVLDAARIFWSSNLLVCPFEPSTCLPFPFCSPVTLLSIMPSFHHLDQDSGLSELNNFLATRSYIDGSAAPRAHCTHAAAARRAPYASAAAWWGAVHCMH